MKNKKTAIKNLKLNKKVVSKLGNRSVKGGAPSLASFEQCEPIIVPLSAFRQNCTVGLDTMYATCY